MDDFEKELKLGFLDEAAQAVADVEQCFLQIEANPEDKPVLDKIFRLAHNLKGSSKAVGFEHMGHFTHEFESLLLKLKNGEIPVRPATISLMLRCNDHLNMMISGLRDNVDATFDSTDLIAEIERHKNGETEEASSEVDAIPSASEFPAEEPPSDIELAAEVPTLEPDIELPFEVSVPADAVAALPDIPLDVLELQAQFDAIQAQVSAELTGVTPAIPDLKIVEGEPVKTAEPAAPKAAAVSKPATAVAGNKPPPPAGNKPAAAADESIRVSLARVEKLQNFVGEMVILQAVLREQVMDSPSLLVKRTAHQLGKVVKEIQDISMSLRMVPVKPTFQKMQRIVRDTAQALGKDINFKLSGEETELDKTVLEKINDPLVHLIRNSVDHGIESADIRVANGKSARGEVNLSAYHQSGKLVIEVKDDGGGLNGEKLRQAAIKKGVIKANAVLTEQECWNLIFAPGFSTKEQTTDISGRGVGMDVVRTNIQELSGEILIDSVLGQGTTFKIFLPLTLAIIDGMIIKVGKERFVIPLSHVHESVQPEPEQIQKTTGLGEILMLRGENLPVYRLNKILGQKCETPDADMIAIVIRSAGDAYAFLVEDIIGQYQVVIKQLGPELQFVKGISGSTILGDGRPALIIEPNDLIKKGKAPGPRELGRSA